jgi:hypothetical protein
LLVGLISGLVFAGSSPKSAEVTVLRGIGAPFIADANGVTGELRVKVRNRAATAKRYRLEVVADPPVRLIAPENPLDVPAGGQRTTAVFVVAPRDTFVAGRREIAVRVSDGEGFDLDTPHRLLGPTPEVRP